MGAPEEDYYFPRGGTTPAIAPEQTHKIKKHSYNKLPRLEILPEKNVTKKKINHWKYSIFLNNSHFKKGFTFLCAIRSVEREEVSVILPFFHYLMYQKINVSDMYSKLSLLKNAFTDARRMFKVGEIYSCSVTEDVIKQHDGYRSLPPLTISPVDVNKGVCAENVQRGMLLQAFVASEEDHGYLLQTGVPGLTAFLPSDNIPPNFKGIGCILWCKVVSSSVDNLINTVQVTANPEKIFKAKLKPPVEQLFPGCRVSVSVVEKETNAVRVQVSGTEIFGLIHHHHLLETVGYNVGDTFIATTLFKVPDDNLYFFSLKTNVGEIPNMTLRTGEKFKEASLIEVTKYNDQKLFALVQLKEGEPYGIMQNFPESCRYSPSISCCVVSVNYLTQFYLCSLVGVFNDLSEGTLVTGKVDRVLSDSYRIKLPSDRYGVCPFIHLMDSPSQPRPTLQKNSEHKFKVFCIKNEICLLTMKPQLVQHPLLTTTDCKAGTFHYGVVNKENLNKGELIEGYTTVEFGASVKGYLPTKNWHVEGLTVGCYFTGEMLNNYPLMTGKPKLPNIGEIFDTTIVKTDVMKKGSLCATVMYGGRVCHVKHTHLVGKSKKKGTKLPAVGSAITVKCLKIVPGEGNPVWLTMKPSLVENDIPARIDDLSFGDLCHGYVSDVSSGNVSVSFLCDLTGTIVDDDISLNDWTLDDTIECYIVGITSSGPLLSLKPPSVDTLVIGQIYSFKVKRVKRRGVFGFVTFKDNTYDGWLPLHELCEDISLREIMLKSITPKMVLKSVLLSTPKDNTAIFTLKTTMKAFALSLPWCNVEKGVISLKELRGVCDAVPCTVASLNEETVDLYSPIGVFPHEAIISSNVPENTDQAQAGASLIGKFTAFHRKKQVISIALDYDLSEESARQWEICLVRDRLRVLKQCGLSPGTKVTFVKSSGRFVTVPEKDKEGWLLGQLGKSLSAYVVDFCSGTIQLVPQYPTSLIKEGAILKVGILKENDYYSIGQVLSDYGGIVYIPNHNVKVNHSDPVRTAECGQIYTVKVTEVYNGVTIGCLMDKKSRPELDKKDLIWIRTVGKDSRNAVKLLDKKSKKNRDLEVKEEDGSSVTEQSNEFKLDSFVEVKELLSSDDEGIPTRRRTKQSYESDTKMDDIVEIKEEIVSDEEDHNRLTSFTDELEIKEESDVEIIPSSTSSDNRGQRKNTQKRKITGSSKSDSATTVKKVRVEKVDASEISPMEIADEFLWNATPQDLAKVTSSTFTEIADEEDLEVVEKAPKTAAARKALEREKEKMLREKEEELLQALEAPKSVDHFERLILSRPDDSKIWIQYMAFHIETTEFYKAKAVARRAFNVISLREEQEKLNVWIALLNMEHTYGSEESFKDTFAEALRCNDDYKVSCAVLDLYVSSNSTLELERLVTNMLKKFKDRPDCWIVCLTALMKGGLVEKARSMIDRAIQSLPQKQHVTLISRFALLENELGNCEQAQTLFDSVLTSYPARIDILFVYLDMLTKSKSHEIIRHVFERAVRQKIPMKKIKSIYSKWLTFEEQYGTPENVAGVKASATEYVQNITSAATATTSS